MSSNVTALLDAPQHGFDLMELRFTALEVTRVVPTLFTSS
jgi:hypothetical protein